MKNVTFPKGFSAGGRACGIKKNGNPDVGILKSEPPAVGFGAFTRNAAAAAPVLYCRETLASGAKISHVLVNSGNANAATGPKGYEDVLTSVAQLRASTKVEGGVLVSSTGVIGEPLPMDALKRGIEDLCRQSSTSDFHAAIMTTDTREKSCAVRVQAGGRTYTVGGCAKGSGMIHPDMGTMFAFITTDAPADRAWLDSTLRAVTDRTFNMVDVDMDTSTSDTALLFASGAAGGEADAGVAIRGKGDVDRLLERERKLLRGERNTSR